MNVGMHADRALDYLDIVCPVFQASGLRQLLLSRNEESVSGDGSTEFYTRNARTLLAHTFTEYGIQDWIDSPCGDCNWQPRIEGFANVSYLGLDIVPGVPL